MYKSVALFPLAGALLAATGAGPAGAATQTYSTPGVHGWTVPSGATSAAFTVRGAQGGAGLNRRRPLIPVARGVARASAAR